MTVSYTAEVSSCRGFGCFLKLLLRWKASVYKLIWTDLLFFLTLYYCLSGVYRLILDEDQKRIFEKVVEFCRAHTSSSPLSFVLGFYVAVVMNRWWDQYISIPWPDSIAVFVSATIHGHDERARVMRRTIVRYVCVCLTLVLTNVSPRVKKRFPTLEHYVDAGLLLENELAIFQSLNCKFPKPSKHWLPIVWASSIVTRARKEGRIRDDFAVKTLLDELNQFRSASGSLYNYDVISIPLVYTQVVTIAVYAYFLTNIIGQQSIVKNSTNDFISFFPVFISLEILFYMGWLKVAETLINPFGEDDDDFEVNWIVDRNLQVSYLIVDEMHHEHPELIRDQYWDEVFPTELPYTAAAEPFREDYPEPSTACIQLTPAQQEFQNPSCVRMDEMDKELQQKFVKRDVNDDTTSGINFEVKYSRSRGQISNKDKMFNCGSVTSSISGSFKRINSVNELIDKCKRFLGKDDRPDETNALGGPLIIDTIQELNEQMTMISNYPENQLKVQDARSQIEALPASVPVDIPQRSSTHYNIDASSLSAPTYYLSSSGENSKSPSNGSYLQMRTQMSVPVEDNAVNMANYDNKLSAHSDSSSNNSEQEEDEFEKLKSERCKQRLEKLHRNLSKCASSECNPINSDDTTPGMEDNSNMQNNL